MGHIDQCAPSAVLPANVETSLDTARKARAPRLAVISLALAVLVAGQDVPTRALVSEGPRGPGDVRQLTYSPDGRLLAVVTTVGLQVRDAASGRVLNSIVDAVPSIPHIAAQFAEPWLSELCWSPDGKRVARVHNGIEIWNPLGSAAERTLPADPADKAFYDLAWSPNGKEIAAHSDAGIAVWDLESSQRVVIPEQAPNDGLAQISGFAWSPRGDQLTVAAGYWESEVIDLWNVRKPALLRRYKVGAEGTPPPPCGDPCYETYTYSSKLAWSPDGSVLALGSGFSGLALWDVRSRALIRRTPAAKELLSLSWSSDSTRLRVGTSSGIRFLNRDSGIPVFNDRTEERVRWIAVSPDGERRAASFDDGRIDLWRGRNLRPAAQIPTAAFGDLHVSVSPDSRYIAGQSWRGWAGVWDLKSGLKVASVDANPVGYGEFAWSPDGQTLAIAPASEPPMLQLLRPSSGQAARLIRLPAMNYSSYTSISWSPNGKRVLVSGALDAVVSVEDGTVQPVPRGRGSLIWDAPEDVARPATPLFGTVLQAPNLRYAALQANDKLTVWDRLENQALWTVDFPLGRSLSQVAWSPDSRQLAYISGPEVVDVWDLAASRVVERWTAPAASQGRGFSQLTWYDKLVAVESLGGAVQLWHQP